MLATMRTIFSLAALALLSACGDGGVVINLTDAPVDDATAVTVRVTGVELQRSDGGTEFLDIDDRAINLLALTAGASTQLVSRDDIGEGSFSGVRLLIDADAGELDSTIDLIDGGQRALQLSGGDLLARRNFTVNEEEATTLTIDFDLRRSLRAPTGEGDYLLVPTLRLVQDDQVGRIAGTVAAGLATADGCDAEGATAGLGNVVYVFAGNVTPDDVNGISPEPLTSARAVLNADTGNYDYTAAFLPAGSYTVAFTCQAERDQPTVDDAIDFSAPQPATVTAGQTVTVDFSGT